MPVELSQEWSVASASAHGTCGEFAQGLLPGGRHFLVTCPISRSATVRLRVRPALELRIHGLLHDQDKMDVALRRTIGLLDAGPLEVIVEHRTDLEVGKGMGSSTADIVASATALASAVNRRLSPERLAAIATSIESSDGTMYSGPAVVDRSTGTALRSYRWWPEFVIVMIIPTSTFDTDSARFEGKERLSGTYDEMLGQFDRAIARRDTLLFAQQSTRSAGLNQRYVPNPYWLQLAEQIAHYDAIGANVAHTGTICGLLFENTAEGMRAAAHAWRDLPSRLPSGVKVEITTTPASPDPELMRTAWRTAR